MTDVLPWEGDDEATSGLDPLKAAGWETPASRPRARSRRHRPAPRPVTLISKSAMPLPLVSPSNRPAGEAQFARRFR